jgi:hypothetical protein
LETIVSLAQQILPLEALDALIGGVLTHISDEIVATLCSKAVQKFNINAIMGLDVDLNILESFADERFRSTGLNELDGSMDLRQCLSEARQLVNLLLSNQPETFTNPVIRQKNYSALDLHKVLAVVEKYRDPPEKYFGNRNPKNAARKKSIDLLIRRLRDSV